MSVTRAPLVAALAAISFAAACKEKTAPLVPANVAAVSAATFSSVSGTAVDAASRPSVKVTTADGTAVPDVSVTFAVTSGGGSGGGAATTNAEGIATAPAWTLGNTVGSNVMTATVTGLTPVTFTATGTPGPPTKLVLTTAPTTSVANRAAFPTQPVITVQDANSNVVTTAGITVSASIVAGGGTLQGTLDAQTNASGVATFTNLAIAGAVGARTLTFSSIALTNVTAPVTTTPGAATTMAKEAGDNQATLPSTAVAIPPAVKITDADGNGVSGRQVTFAVTLGGGSVSGGSPISGSTGVAAVTSWTMGSGTGTNTLSATSTGLTGSPLTFTATSTNTLVDVTAVSPATLTSGATATITGNGFSATAANNTVTIDGVAAAVTAATGTSLTVTVPTLPCTAGHNGAVSVTVSGVTGSRNHPVQAAATHTLAVGGSVVLSTSTAARCNELHNAAASAMYYVSVYNTSTTYSPTGAAFELKGSAGAAAAIVPDASQMRSVTRPRSPLRRPLSPEEQIDRNHLQFRERDLEFLNQNKHRWAGQRRTASLVGGGTIAHAVGDAVALRMRDISKTTCNDFVDINGRVAYVGTKGMIIEDNANPLAGTIDTTYAQIGSEFDTVMWPILENNFGNALINDAVLDNNGKFIMVFSDKVRSLSSGIAGFVTGCDLFSRTGAGFPNASSNFGEYFYATSPTMSGDIACTGGTGACNSPPRWRWSMRGTIIHEVKHIVSIAERFAKNPSNPTFEVSWLEETTARLSEELYERARYGFTQKSNIGYGSVGNQVGPYCGVRLACNQARGIVRVFEELGVRWYQSPHDYSPIGRIDASDFSFYATGWSLVRWALDRSPTAESTVLKNMTQHATLTGIANFDAHMGTTYVDALPKWTLAMAVDDYPSVTISDAAIAFPSWNLRNVFSGYKADFPSASFAAWPLVPLSSSFGAFSSTASVRAGTAAIVQLFGTQSAKQVLELKANGSSASAPAELRMSIVRVQ